MEKMISSKDIMQKLGITRFTLYRWIKNGRFPKPIKPGGGKQMWREETVSSWLEKQ